MNRATCKAQGESVHQTVCLEACHGAAPALEPGQAPALLDPENAIACNLFRTRAIANNNELLIFIGFNRFSL